MEKLNVTLGGSVVAVTLAELSEFLSEPPPASATATTGFREVEIHLKLGTLGFVDTFCREIPEAPP